MALSEKQQKVLNWVREHGIISTSEAVRIIGGNLYCNAEKHVGDTLSRLVKARLIRRIKPGLFGPFVGKPVDDFKLEDPK